MFYIAIGYEFYTIEVFCCAFDHGGDPICILLPHKRKFELLFPTTKNVYGGVTYAVLIISS